MALPMQCLPEDDGFALALRIVSRLDHIRLVRAALCGLLQHQGVRQHDTDLLTLAVAEILTNSIEHGLQGDDHRDLEVCVRIAGNQVEVAVHDDAPYLALEKCLLHPSEHPEMESPSDQWSMRGHGLQIVHSVVDSVSVTREQGRNRVLLKKVVGLQPI